ncbi:MAG: hypothetical protein COV37_09305 [Bdellovibrio sp. CG11_big_fil_rev_8_21_14_0_20_39_38]|nr:MAG: hypothetical protein COW78_11650 [Bdellovibrio sp. CG22_combo_CG10-13_8_21_14_all_39_27]PIR35283.1 MAG: hypothetical protein COV37_09305 [Bdellovibrio sp. CG11_big_fil_rev_8_21_14_0_20_39_38]
MHYAISVFFLFISLGASAEFKDVSLGLGLYDQYLGKVQTNRGGDTNKFDYQIFLVADSEYALNKKFSLIPRISLVKPGHTRDTHTDKFIWWLSGEIGFNHGDFLFHTGLGLLMTYISSSGGTVALPNGTGTDNFFLPDGESTSRNVVYLLGLDYFITKEWSARPQLHVTNPFNSRNRALSYTLSFSYHFYDNLWNSK